MESKQSAKIKLIIWGIFFAIILIPMAISDIKSKKNTQVNQTTSENIINKTINDNQIYKKVVNDLNKYNYEYKFIVTNETLKTTYFGKILYEEVLGYKEENNTVTKYYINENIIYNNTDKSNIIGYLDNTEYDSLLDFNNILDIILNMNYNEENNKLIFNDDTYDISISDVDNEININILYNNIEYKLTYNNINELTVID